MTRCLGFRLTGVSFYTFNMYGDNDNLAMCNEFVVTLFVLYFCLCTLYIQLVTVLGSIFCFKFYVSTIIIEISRKWYDFNYLVKQIPS